MSGCYSIRYNSDPRRARVGLDDVPGQTYRVRCANMLTHVNQQRQQSVLNTFLKTRDLSAKSQHPLAKRTCPPENTP
jgi:hypothetical protein